MLHDKTVVHVAQYAAPYMGNFIASLVTLESALHNESARMVYVFPESCKKTPWIDDFSSDHTVYFVTDEIMKRKIFFNYGLATQLIDIFMREQPDIIHTHFDGYDLPVIFANKRLPKQAKLVWHHHNPRTLVNNPLKRLYQKLCFFRQYVLYGRFVHIVTASESCLDEISRYGFDLDRAIAITNGICEERIRCRELSLPPQKRLNFLCFGGRGDDKGIDVLLCALAKLPRDINPNVLLVRGQDTDIFLEQAPENLDRTMIKLVPPSEDINTLFDSSDCFISCSRRETFSYAAHEAVLYGLPLISSDIPALSALNQLPSVIAFENENAEELAAAITKMTEDRSFRMPDNLQIARSFVQNNLTAAIWARRITEYYSYLLTMDETL